MSSRLETSGNEDESVGETCPVHDAAAYLRNNGEHKTMRDAADTPREGALNGRGKLLLRRLSARDLLGKLLGRGLLRSATAKGPVTLHCSIDSAELLSPKLFAAT